MNGRVERDIERDIDVSDHSLSRNRTARAMPALATIYSDVSKGLKSMQMIR